ncbi:MAG: Hpt domain-containing protein [Gemmobacter sp.]
MIDRDRIATLRAEIGEEDLAEVVALFMEEADESITRLRAAATPARQAEELHFLKGCALNLGFAALAGLCAGGEDRIAAGQPGAVDADRLAALFAASRQAFEEGG